MAWPQAAIMALRLIDRCWHGRSAFGWLLSADRGVGGLGFPVTVTEGPQAKFFCRNFLQKFLANGQLPKRRARRILPS
jgi:hypothetical protein